MKKLKMVKVECPVCDTEYYETDYCGTYGAILKIIESNHTDNYKVKKIEELIK